MSQTEQLHKGMVIRHQGQLLTVVDYNVAQTGKQRATVHVKLRALQDNHSVERNLDELGKLEEVPTEHRQMQYLYAAGNEHVFMDTESFEQFSLDDQILHDAFPYLVMEKTYRFLVVEGQVAAIELPDMVVLEVVDTAPVQHAGGATNVHKEARVNSGATIQVPLFIKNGDHIRVSTQNQHYLGKDKEHSA